MDFVEQTALPAIRQEYPTFPTSGKRGRRGRCWS